MRPADAEPIETSCMASLLRFLRSLGSVKSVGHTMQLQSLPAADGNCSPRATGAGGQAPRTPGRQRSSSNWTGSSWQEEVRLDKRKIGLLLQCIEVNIDAARELESAKKETATVDEAAARQTWRVRSIAAKKIDQAAETAQAKTRSLWLLCAGGSRLWKWRKVIPKRMGEMGKIGDKGDPPVMLGKRSRERPNEMSDCSLWAEEPDLHRETEYHLTSVVDVVESEIEPEPTVPKACLAGGPWLVWVYLSTSLYSLHIDIGGMVTAASAEDKVGPSVVLAQYASAEQFRSAMVSWQSDITGM